MMRSGVEIKFRSSRKRNNNNRLLLLLVPILLILLLLLLSLIASSTTPPSPVVVVDAFSSSSISSSSSSSSSYYNSRHRRGGSRTTNNKADDVLLDVSSSLLLTATPGSCRRSTSLLQQQTTASSSSSSSSSDVVDEDKTTDSQSQSQKFDWYKSWYPLVPVNILDEAVPHAFQVLGVDMVIWKDSKLESSPTFGPKSTKEVGSIVGRLFGKNNNKRVGGTWNAFEDACPHRKVPLSQGRVENDGSLLCSYHAWRFDGRGRLLDAPQINSTDSSGNPSKKFQLLDRLKSNPRAQCNAYPTQVVDGLLWVWPQSGDDARLEAMLTPLPKPLAPSDDDTIDNKRIFVQNWEFRELPYGGDYFIENAVDPAHVPVSHHGYIGSRYSDQTRPVQLVKPVTKDGFAIESFSPSMIGQAGPSRTTFVAPACSYIENDYGNGASYNLELYATPSRPGFCYFSGRFTLVRDVHNNKFPTFLGPATLPIPIWLHHFFTPSFINQDSLFLHQQERYLAKTKQYQSFDGDGNNDGTAAPSTSSDYKNSIVAIEADRGVLAYRDWLDKIAGGRIPYKNNPSIPSEPDYNVVFDVWSGHTKKCKVCQGAVRNLRRARFVSFAMAICFGVIRPAANKRFLSLGGALGSVALGLLLNKMITMFYRQEFHHGDND